MTSILISTLISLLASTVKNPRSEKAKKLRSTVEKLHEATEQFLAQVPEA
ncbi:MAG: hypothetical protein AB1757_21250 [Acidobacteriota bacterium]